MDPRRVCNQRRNHQDARKAFQTKAHPTRTKQSEVKAHKQCLDIFSLSRNGSLSDAQHPLSPSMGFVGMRKGSFKPIVQCTDFDFSDLAQQKSKKCKKLKKAVVAFGNWTTVIEKGPGRRLLARWVLHAYSLPRPTSFSLHTTASPDRRHSDESETL